MTLAVASRNDYVGTGSVDTYDYGFKIFAASDLEVTVRNTDDVETSLAYPDDFDVTDVGDPDGGTIVLVAGALTLNYTLTIRRVVALEQATDLRNQQGFFPEVLEDTFDYLTMIVQQQQDSLDRAALLPVTLDPDLVSPTLPIPGAGAYLRWNVAGDALEAVSVGPGDNAFMNSGSGASSRTWTAKVGEWASVKDYGALGNGVHDDTAAFVAALAAHYRVYVPAGTYRVTSFSVPTGALMFGDGWAVSIIKTVNGAGLTFSVRVPNTSTNVRFRDLTFDGNRAGGGMIDGVSSPLKIEGSFVDVENCEIMGGSRYGTYVGDDSVLSHSVNYDGCYIHDNGGVTNDTGFGVGIGSGGLVIPKDIGITRCLIQSNYNTVAKPGDSTAINLYVQGVRIQNNLCINNFNVNGGQIVVQGYPDQTATIDANIGGNHIKMTTTFGTPKDRTCGIEIQGRDFIVANNTIDLRSDSGSSIDGISIGGDATHASGRGVVCGNVMRFNGAVSVGINFDPAGLSTGIFDVECYGNVVKDATVGIETDAAVYCYVHHNNFRGCGQPQSGTLTNTFYMFDNIPFGTPNGANGRTHRYAVAVASANDLVLGNSNSNEVTGTTTINRISTAGWFKGDRVLLSFTNSLTVKNGIAVGGAFATILLSGSSDFAATDKDTLELEFNGVEWVQVTASHN